MNIHTPEGFAAWLAGQAPEMVITSFSGVVVALVIWTMWPK